MKIIPLKKRFSLAAKFNTLTIALILATSVGICLFTIRLEMTNYYNELLNHGKIIADTTAKNCEFGIYTENQAVLLPVLDRLSADSDIAYVAVMNRQRLILAFRVFRGAGKPQKHIVPINDSSTEDIHQDIIDEQDGKRYIEILSPLMSEGANDVKDVLIKDDMTKHEPTIIGYLRLGLTQENFQKRLHELILSTTLFTSLIVLIGTGFTIFLSRRITSPLKRLTMATQEISEGKFDSAIEIRTNDEILDLAQSFDHMQGRLRAYHDQVEERIAKEQRHLLEKEKMLMDLHDGIGGITTNISILSELGQSATDIESIKKALATISRLARDGVSEIRSFMQSLDSRELNWRALASELRNLGTTMVEPHGISFAAEISVDDVPDQPGSLLWIDLIRIYKEALTNVIKHSHAHSVGISLKVASTGLMLIVRDDGIGWNEAPDNGRGLPNMKKRAQEVGGTVTVSASETGAEVKLEIPLPLKLPPSSTEL
jgi:signal transduction histidine kinase